MPSPRRKPAPTAVQNPLETYLRDINETSLLSAEDEKRLARAIAAGDAEARDHMVRANLRLVVNIARGYANRGLPLLIVGGEERRLVDLPEVCLEGILHGCDWLAATIGHDGVTLRARGEE